MELHEYGWQAFLLKPDHLVAPSAYRPVKDSLRLSVGSQRPETKNSRVYAICTGCIRVIAVGA